MIKKILSLVLLFTASFIQAQDMMAVQEPEMADILREDGKIWIVITVIGMIFTALVLFMIYLERRLKKLEERIKKRSE